MGKNGHCIPRTFLWTVSACSFYSNERLLRLLADRSLQPHAIDPHPWAFHLSRILSGFESTHFFSLFLNLRELVLYLNSLCISLRPRFYFLFFNDNFLSPLPSAQLSPPLVSTGEWKPFQNFKISFDIFES